MCCCSSHIPHDETQKFLLFGDDVANNQIIFEETKQQFGNDQIGRKDNTAGERQKLEKKWKIQKGDKHWLFERSFEVHSIVEFIFADDPQLLALTGPEQIGKDVIISKAVIFSLLRHKKIVSQNVYRLDLDGINDPSQVFVKIAEAL